jgi:hypothetical protein
MVGFRCPKAVEKWIKLNRQTAGLMTLFAFVRELIRLAPIVCRLVGDVIAICLIRNPFAIDRRTRRIVNITIRLPRPLFLSSLVDSGPLLINLRINHKSQSIRASFEPWSGLVRSSHVWHPVRFHLLNSTRPARPRTVIGMPNQHHSLSLSLSLSLSRSVRHSKLLVDCDCVGSALSLCLGGSKRRGVSFSLASRFSCLAMFV